MTANLKDREVKKDTMKLKKRRRVETILSGIHTEGMIQDIRGMVREETIPDIIERMIEEIIEAQEEKDEIIEETAIIIKILILIKLKKGMLLLIKQLLEDFVIGLILL